MIKQFTFTIFFSLIGFACFAQSDAPIWDVGTTWHYEKRINHYTITSEKVEVLDTVRVNGQLLYDMGKAGLYKYEGDKVFRYIKDHDFFHLVYDFSEESSYGTQYRPVCDPSFNEAQHVFKNYDMMVDSITDFTMPDNSIRKISYIHEVDSIFTAEQTSITHGPSRRILERIGFMDGWNGPHDWGLGAYVCDDLSTQYIRLRCFEDAQNSFNFVGIPCDSTWYISNTKEIQEEIELAIYPNPATGSIKVSGIDRHEELVYEVYTLNGSLVDSGSTKMRTIPLRTKGELLVKIARNGRWILKRVTNL